MFYIIRHGQTDWNVEHLLQGKSDIPLNEEGRRMAIEARQQCQDIDFDICYCSPLQRARQTAELLLEGRDVPILTDARLEELGFGECEGRANASSDPESFVYNLFHNPAYYVEEQGAEKLSHLYERTGSFIEEVLRPLFEQGKTVLVVGHGAMNCSLINQLTGTEIADFWKYMTGNCKLMSFDTNTFLPESLMKKYEALKAYLYRLKKAAVAFSAGVDSTLLLKVAKDVLEEQVVAITADLHSFPRREMEQTKNLCEQLQVAQYLCTYNELEVENFSKNPKNRCYLCKKQIFLHILEKAKELGIEYVLEGTNLDDLGDYRPGLKAIEELKIISPLKECGFTKQDIRDLSHYLKLDTWKKPAFACLSTRFPYNEEITEEKLRMVEQAEQYLYDIGLEQFRVRIHGLTARIEVEEADIEVLAKADCRRKLVEKFQEYGFVYVSLDLAGYCSGNMNKV